MAKKASSEQALEGPLHVVSLRTENIRNLSLVELEFKGNEFLPVVGGNGAGKSSVLDSMMYALCGKRVQGEMPVKQGEKKAEIVLTLEGPKGKIRCTRKFQPSGNQEWSIVGEDGTRYASPEELMETLIGPISFDPSKFLTAESKDQRRMLLAAAGIDATALEGAINKAFMRRRDAKRDHEAAENKAKALGPVPAEEQVDVDAAHSALAVLNNASMRRQLAEEKLAAVVREGQDNAREVEAINTRIAALEQERSALLEARPGIQERHRQAKADLAAVPVATPERIQEAKAAVQDAQARVLAQSRRETIAAAHRERDILAGHVEQADAELEEARKALADAVGGALPIKGMSCTDDGLLLLNDRPLAEYSTGEKLKVATAIALRHQPQIRLMQIRDASLLSAENIKAVSELAKKYDMLILAEFVNDPNIRPAIIMTKGEARVEP